MPPWSLISPASRGIGFALARHVLRTTKAPVVATARGDVKQTREELLEELPSDVRGEERLRVVRVDVLDESSIASAASTCHSHFPPSDHHLQLAFIVPGLLFPEKSPSQINADDALLTFRTNTLGPMLMLKHFAPFLPRKSSKTKETHRESQDEDLTTNLPPLSTTAIMSARVGSISDNALGGWYSYRASKAAVNQVVKTFDNHLKTSAGDRAMCVALHPGTVRTGLSREFWGNVKREKLFEGEWVAGRLCEVLEGLGVEGRGRCWDWEGKVVEP